MGIEAYILIKAWVIEIHWIGPGVVIPDVISEHVESPWEDSFLTHGLVSSCNVFSDI